jgi:BRCA1-associated protein
VWDYVSDGFVHRLIQSKSGLVELTPPPSTRRASASASDGAACSPNRAPDVGDLDAQLEDALVASKLDAIASEYDVLLTSQLESQRKYFEGLLEAANARRAGTMSREDESRRNADVVARAMNEAKDAKREVRRLQKANASHVATIDRLREELEHARALGDSLAENVETLRTAATRAEKRREIELSIKNAAIKDLEEENRDLMLFLDTSNKLNVDASLAEQIAGGTIVGVDADTTSEPTPSRNPTHERLKSKVEAERRKRC